MKNQQDHWNTKHRTGGVDHVSDNPTSFAMEVMDIIPPMSTILELGCGTGNDSIGFARSGHSVKATDFSEVAIQNCQKRYKGTPNLEFELLDITQPLDFPNSSFDVVYARLSLHYFTDQVTRAVIGEIYRVLQPGGHLCFICKSIDDPYYGLGTEIEADVFEDRGHLRHFFSEDYVRSLLEDAFDIELIKSGQETFYHEKSAYVKAIARTVK